MIDFGHALFDKKIEIKENKKIETKTKWPTVRLGEIADIKKGKSITSAELKQGDIKVVAGGQNYAFLHNESNCPENTITVSASGAYAGYVNFWEEPIFASDCATVNCRDLTMQRYVYNYLKYMQNAIYDLQKGQAQPHVYPADLKKFLVPLPSGDIQKIIENKCSEVDKETERAIKEIEYLKGSINDIVKNIKGKNDLLTVRSNGSQELVGRFMYIDQEPQEKTSFSGFSIRVRPDCKIVNSEFLYYLLSSSDIRKQLTTGSNGSNIKSLNQTLLSKVEIYIPSMKEQMEILAELLVIENKIVEARKIIETAVERKKEIIEKELI